MAITYTFPADCTIEALRATRGMPPLNVRFGTHDS